MFDCLDRRIPELNIRYLTFFYALKLMEQNKTRIIVETGTARGGCAHCQSDGCSTLIFGDWAKQNGAILYSVDIEKQALLKAKNDLGPSNTCVHLIQSDSVKFLKEFSKQIDFLYLDSYDFDSNNPLDSQNHHLNEIQAAYPKLSPNCAVLIDDCDLPFGGKGHLVIEYLLKNGWMIALKHYQAILVRKEVIFL